MKNPFFLQMRNEFLSHLYPYTNSLGIKVSQIFRIPTIK